jgi:hypothetical protein
MGSKHSSSGKNIDNKDKISKAVIEKKSDEKAENINLMQINNSSSYREMNSENSSDIMMIDTKESNTYSEEIANKLKLNQESKNLIRTIFHWKDQGNNVYITGNFSNWNQWFLMTKEPNQLFSLMLVNI